MGHVLFWHGQYTLYTSCIYFGSIYFGSIEVVNFDIMRNRGQIVFKLFINCSKERIPWHIIPMHLLDDAIKWKHFSRNWPFVRGIHRSPVNSPHKGQWRGTLMFSLICAWIKGWVNNGEAGGLRRHPAHYDVTVMGTAKVEEMGPHGRQKLAKPVYYTHWWLPNAISRISVDMVLISILWNIFLLRWRRQTHSLLRTHLMVGRYVLQKCKEIVIHHRTLLWDRKIWCSPIDYSLHNPTLYFCTQRGADNTILKNRIIPCK